MSKLRKFKFYSSLLLILTMVFLLTAQVNVFVSPDFVAKMQAVIDAYNFTPTGTWDFSGAATSGLADPDANEVRANVTNFDNILNSYNSNAQLIFEAIDSLYAIQQNGFSEIDRENTTLSFDDGTLTFSITPVSGTFSYWSNGDKFTSTGASKTITDTEGIWFCYFDKNGELQTTQTWNDSLIREYCIVSELYWDAANNIAIHVGDERHGNVMSPWTHYWLHDFQGAQYYSGMALNDFVADQNGSLNSHAQFSVASGEFYDEDLEHEISAVASTVGLNIFYKDGVAGNWRMDVADGISAKSFVGGNGRLAYNQYTGGAWQQTEVGEADYVLMHIFATNDITDKYIAIQGEEEYGNLLSARRAAIIEINNISLAGVPVAEIVPIGSVIFQTDKDWVNSKKCKIVTTDEGANYVDFRSSTSTIGAGTASDHGSLTGLGDDDHAQYLLRSDSLLTWISFTQLADTSLALRTDLASGGATTYDEYFILDAEQGHTDLDSALAAIQGSATNPCIVLLPGKYTLGTNTTIEDIGIVGAVTLDTKGFYKQEKSHFGAEIELNNAYFTTRDNVTIKNVAVTVASGSNIFGGFYMSQTGTAIDNVKFENCIFYDVANNNAHASPSWIDNTENSSLIVRNCGFYGLINTEKWYSVGDNDSYNLDVTFEDNYCYAMKRGYSINAGVTGSNISIIKDNVFEDCDYGIFFTDGCGGTYHILNNLFFSSNSTDIDYPSSASSCTVYDYGNGNYDFQGEFANMTAYDGPDENFHLTTDNFNGNLSSSDSTLALALETIDGITPEVTQSELDDSTAALRSDLGGGSAPTSWQSGVLGGSNAKTVSLPTSGTWYRQQQWNLGDYNGDITYSSGTYSFDIGVDGFYMITLSGSADIKDNIIYEIGIAKSASSPSYYSTITMVSRNDGGSLFRVPFCRVWMEDLTSSDYMSVWCKSNGGSDEIILHNLVFTIVRIDYSN